MHKIITLSDFPPKLLIIFYFLVLFCFKAEKTPLCWATWNNYCQINLYNNTFNVNISLKNFCEFDNSKAAFYIPASKICYLPNFLHGSSFCNESIQLIYNYFCCQWCLYQFCSNLRIEDPSLSEKSMPLVDSTVWDGCHNKKMS